MGFSIRQIKMILLAAVVCLCASAACSAETVQDDSASDRAAIRKWAIMEELPASILVDWKKYDFLTYDELSGQEMDIFKSSPDAAAAEDGFLVFPKDFAAGDAPYYLAVCEYSGLPEEITENVFDDDPGSDFLYFDFQDASESIMDAVYQEMTHAGELSSGEKYYEAEEAKFIVLTCDHEGIKTDCLTTCINGHTVALYALPQDKANRKEAQDALYDLAPCLVRGDMSKNLAGHIRNNKVSEKPSKFYSWGSIGTIYINSQYYYSFLNGNDIGDSDILLDLDVTADEVREFMGDAQMLVLPRGDLWKNTPIALRVYCYSLELDPDSFLREKTVNKSDLRKAIMDSFEDSDEYYLRDYTDRSGRIYLVFEESVDTEEGEAGILYYMTVCSGDLIIFSCQYEIDENEDYREAAEEMLLGFTAGFHDARDEYYLPDINFDVFSFINESNGSDLIPIELGKSYTISDHELTESDFSGTGEETHHYHSYLYARTGEKTKASKAMKLLGMNSDHSLFFDDGEVYKENYGISSHAGDYLTVWYKDSGGVWTHCDFVQAASLFAGYKTLSDCEELFVIDLGAGDDDVTEYIKVTWTSYEDMLALFSPETESQEPDMSTGEEGIRTISARKSYDLVGGRLTVKLDQRIFDAFLKDNTDNRAVLKHQNLSEQEDLDAYVKMLGYEFFAVSTERGYPENELDFIVETPDLVKEGVDDLRTVTDKKNLAKEIVSDYGQETYTFYDTEDAAYIVFENGDKVSYFTIRGSRTVCLSLRIKYTEINEEHRALMREIMDDVVWTSDAPEQAEPYGDPAIETTLVEGEEIQNILHDLSGFVFDYKNGVTSDDNIKSFRRSAEKAPEGAGTRLLSAEGEPEVIAWFDDGTIYWYSDAQTVRAVDMAGMFKSCGGLEKVDLSGINTSAVNNMSCMFMGCEGLTELDLSELDTSSVTDMSYMFAYCKNLDKLDVSGFKTGNVTTMRNMFADCNSLRRLDLTSFDTSNVTEMCCMFYLCGGLEELDLSSFDTSNVTSMDTMFRGCSSLTELNLSSFDTSKTVSMASMFECCTSLTRLDLSNFDTGKTVSMEYMFDYCRNLEELDLSSFDTSNVQEMSFMFTECSSLTELDLSNFDTKKVLSFEAMFDCCHNLERLDLRNFSTVKSQEDFAMFHGCESLTWVGTDDARLQAKVYHIMVLGYDGLGVG